MTVISNTTVLSNFASIGQLEMLHQLFTTLYIPTEVYEEMQTGLDEGYRFYQTIEQITYPLAPKGWLRLTGITGEQEVALLSKLPRRLHSGEAACLAIARYRDWLLLTDDLTAREEATRLKIRKSGSIGCLVLAVEHSLCTLPQANDWLNEMIQQNYRAPLTDLTPLLKPSK